MFRIITGKDEVKCLLTNQVQAVIVFKGKHIKRGKVAKCLLNNQVQAAIVFEIKAFACLGLSVLSSVALFVASFQEIALSPRRNQVFFHFFVLEINFSSTLLKICKKLS